GPLRTLREDVHIHAPAIEVYGRLGAAHQEFWPAAVSDVDTSGGLAFRLAMPLRNERAALMRSSEEAPRYLEFAANGDGGALRSLTWAVNSEGPREVHLIVEIAYAPAGGPLGWALEEMLHRPFRRQALRDTLWRLKLLAEGSH